MICRLFNKVKHQKPQNRTKMPASPQNHILIIKLSALGDFIQNLGIMRAIREHHKEARITLLTTKPYQEIAEKSGYVDDIILDPRPKFFQIKKWWQLKKKLNKEQFTRVYDLQINDRTAIYYSLFTQKPEWVGALKKEARNKSGLAFDRHKEMIKQVGIKNINIDKMDWINNEIIQFKTSAPYILIVPGCAPTRPEKRWPATHYIALCNALTSQHLQPVIIGTENEQEITDEIAQNCPQVLNLTGKTSLFDIVTLARKASIAVGNDTGPMHLIGPTGCKTITLFSGYSDPARHRPLGDNIHTLQEQDIADICPETVLRKIKEINL